MIAPRPPKKAAEHIDTCLQPRSFQGPLHGFAQRGGEGGVRCAQPCP